MFISYMTELVHIGISSSKTGSCWCLIRQNVEVVSIDVMKASGVKYRIDQYCMVIELNKNQKKIQHCTCTLYNIVKFARKEY